MPQSDDQIRSRAAALAEEVAVGLHQGGAVEWLEEVLGSALLEVARRERERCAAVADDRVAMWEASARRLGAGPWPAAARGKAPPS
jgi:hypothetical protein